MLSRLLKLFKESFVYSAGSLIVKFGGFLIIPLYRNYTTIDEFGLIMLFEIIYQFASAISGWGIKSGFQRWYYDMSGEKQKRSLFFTAFSTTFFTTLIATLAIYFIVSSFSYQIFQYEVPIKAIKLFMAAAFLKMLTDVPFILIRLQQKPVKQTTYQTVNILLTIIATFVPLQFLGLGFEGVYWGQLVANAITIIILIPLIFRNSYFKFYKSKVIEMMKFGAPLVLSNLMIIIFSLSDRYIVNIFRGLEDVSSFSLAFKISSLLQFVILTPFFTSYSYDYYRYMNKPTNDRYYIKSFTYFIYIMSFTGLIITLFAKEALYILNAGKDGFSDGIILVPVMIVGVIISGMRMVFTLPLQKVKKTKSISFVLIISGLLNFVLNLLVIPFWGKVGAAVTTTISQLFATIWFYQIISKQEDDTYELKKIFKTILIATLLMYGYVLIPKFHILFDLFLKVAFIPLMLILMYIFNCFEKIEIEKIIKNLKKWKDPENWQSNIKELIQLKNEE